MTEKEKAKAYDEAIERAKKLYGNGITEEIFPELKESDDDRIKKDLIQWVNEFPDIIWRGHYKKDIIAWLEKQDKKSSWKPSKEEMDALYSLSYITNEYDGHKEDVITHLYQDLKREFFNDSSYENMFSLDNKENDVRRRSTIQVLEYARSLDAYNQYGKADIDKNIAWLENQEDKDKLIQELGEYKVKYTQEVLEKHINSMSNKDDERLRKTAIAFLKDFAEQGYENAVECIAWLEKQGEQEQLYIRFGEIPTDEKSKIYRGEIEVGIENGVSVYPAFKTNEGNIVLGLNLPITKTTLHTQQHLVEYDNRPCYLVKGDYIGKDTDGQPLINNVSIIEKIDNYKVKEKIGNIDNQNYIKPINMDKSKFRENDWLGKEGKQNLPSINERAWLYLVSDVLTWKDGIGQYLDDPRVQELAKRLCNEYAQKLYNPLNTGKDGRKEMANRTDGASVNVNG